MHDFISELDQLTINDTNKNNFWRDYLKKETKEWEDYCANSLLSISSSNSFMNIRYSLFVLQYKYKINYQLDVNDLTLELGSVRACIVHHKGDLLDYDKGNKYTFKETLSQTIKFLNVYEDSSNITEFFTNEYLQKVIFSLRELVETLGNSHRG